MTLAEMCANAMDSAHALLLFMSLLVDVARRLVKILYTAALVAAR